MLPSILNDTNIGRVMKNSDAIDELRTIIVMMQHKINTQSKQIDWLLCEHRDKENAKYRKAYDFVFARQKKEQEFQRREKQKQKIIKAKKEEELRRSIMNYEAGFVTPPVRKRSREEEPPAIGNKNGPVKKRLLLD